MPALPTPDHYRKKVQPWDLIDAYGLSYHAGAAIKYIARHREKNYIEDLRKAIAEIEREIEVLTIQSDQIQTTI